MSRREPDDPLLYGDGDKGYLGLRGQEWWGFADETCGWTLAHLAAARNKVLKFIMIN